MAKFLIIQICASRGRLFGLIALALAGATPAAAHPHVWVTAHEEVIFQPGGKIAAIRNSWIFDDMYSAFAVQGLAKDGQLATKEQLAPLAKTNVESLSEFGYFTFAKNAGQKVDFGPPRDYSLEERPDKLVVLTFTVPLKEPLNPGKAFSFSIYDPTFFVDFSLAKTNPVALVSAPKGCSIGVLGANPLDVDDAKKLSEAFYQNLSPGTNFGMKLADRVIVACP
jgi:ABC-type uncharacterized transport system substrate-binding protein